MWFVEVNVDIKIVKVYHTTKQVGSVNKQNNINSKCELCFHAVSLFFALKFVGEFSLLARRALYFPAIYGSYIAYSYKYNIFSYLYGIPLRYVYEFVSQILQKKVVHKHI